MGEQEPSPQNGPEEHAIMMRVSEFTASYFEKNKELFFNLLRFHRDVSVWRHVSMVALKLPRIHDETFSQTFLETYV